MAQARFKVGQRVRVARTDGNGSSFVGKHGVIERIYTGRRFHRYVVLYNAPEVAPNHFGYCRAAFKAWMLEPLRDPDADAFLESIRKLKPLHEEPKAPVRREVIAGISGQRHPNDNREVEP